MLVKWIGSLEVFPMPSRPRSGWRPPLGDGGPIWMPRMGVDTVVDVGVFDGSIVDEYVDDSADHFGHFGQWFSEHVDDYYSLIAIILDDCSVNVDDVRVFF